jgi:hypothetical protein
MSEDLAEGLLEAQRAISDAIRALREMGAAFLDTEEGKALMQGRASSPGDAGEGHSSSPPPTDAS